MVLKWQGPEDMMLPSKDLHETGGTFVVTFVCFCGWSVQPCWFMIMKTVLSSLGYLEQLWYTGQFSQSSFAHVWQTVLC